MMGATAVIPYDAKRTKDRTALPPCGDAVSKDLGPRLGRLRRA